VETCFRPLRATGRWRTQRRPNQTELLHFKSASGYDFAVNEKYILRVISSVSTELPHFPLVNDVAYGKILYYRTLFVDCCGIDITDV
jgi:hypothetical protein